VLQVLQRVAECVAVTMHLTLERFFTAKECATIAAKTSRGTRVSQKSAFLSIDSSCPQKSVLLSCPFVEENMFSSLENTFSKVRAVVN